MKVWYLDVPSGKRLKSYDGHNGDVAGLSLKPNDQVGPQGVDSINNFEPKIPNPRTPKGRGHFMASVICMAPSKS